MIRSKIICHMMASIDGKITYGKVNGQSVPDSSFDNFYDLYVQLEEKMSEGAWMCGRVTMEMFVDEVGTPLDEFKNHEVEYVDNIVEYSNRNFSIVLDQKGLLRWKDNCVVTGPQDNRTKNNFIVIVSKTTPKEYLAFLKSKNISFLICGEDQLDLNLVLEKLYEKFQLETIILEGGAITNGTFLTEGLIDEISLLILPFVINNADAPRVFDKVLTEHEMKNFKLNDVQKLERDTVWLRYSKI